MLNLRWIIKLFLEQEGISFQDHKWKIETSQSLTNFFFFKKTGSIHAVLAGRELTAYTT